MEVQMEVQMENGKRLVVVIKDKMEPGKAMNALAHAMLGFGCSIPADGVKINSYVDADGGVHDNISEMPIVILKSTSNKIRNLRKMAIQAGMHFVDFTDTMSIGTYEEEYELTKTKKDIELDYWAIVLYGDSDLVSEWTGKFSLYR